MYAGFELQEDSRHITYFGEVYYSNATTSRVDLGRYGVSLTPDTGQEESIVIEFTVISTGNV